MKIQTLEVSNFRAIRKASLRDLPEMVVIAGPNGCGKSCLFDALRLLKSAYGGYQPNEWQQWFGEFQIRLATGSQDLLKLFQDTNKEIRIASEFILHDSEKSYLQEHASELIRKSIWEDVAPESSAWVYTKGTPIAAQQRRHEQEVTAKAKEETDALLEDLKNDVFKGELIIGSDLAINVNTCPTLEVLFSVYSPQVLGVIDYHGPNRNYQREQIGGINLNIQTTEQQLSQHALYNYASKYANIKTQMAGSYIKELLAKECGVSPKETASVTSTLKELFATFFPGKEFLGPKPTPEGHLDFPVRTESGALHDINDLSSGEKEVLYGYLRLRDTAPRNSVLLLDEPELHLNPRLIQGLPQFYFKHLGQFLNNQIWLLTHSDALLRQAVGRDGFVLFHMQPVTSIKSDDNQLHAVHASEDVERLVIDLVGDLAAYRPGAKVVIFEGGGDSEFDLEMANTLFPDFQEKVNAISGGNKIRVRELHRMLEETRKKAALPTKFFSIVDQDIEELDEIAGSGTSQLKWDVYHIENYLLESRFILEALSDMLANKCPFSDEKEVDQALVECARKTLGGLVRHRMEITCNNRLVSSIHTRVDPTAPLIAPKLFEAAKKSLERINQAIKKEISLTELEALEETLRNRYESSLHDGDWRKTFRGRDILGHFIGEYGNGIKYPIFRNLIVARMRNAGFQPLGMQNVIKVVMGS